MVQGSCKAFLPRLALGCGEVAPALLIPPVYCR